jgi:Tol biopolymer transport system component
MRTSSGRGFAAWGFLSLIVLTFAGLAAVAGFYPASRVRGAAPLAPRVGAITQITHDGYGKTSVVADDTQVYVSELEAANRVIARVSLPEANRSLFPESSNTQVVAFTNPRAVDLSADHTKLLVSVKDTSGKDASGDNQFWSVPVAGGSPERVGELTGRDASWSANGAQLVLAKGSALYLADAAGTKTHELYKASGSVFAPRFSPDGRAIRFTVTDAEQNTTALWEVGRDGSNPRPLLGNWPYKATACCGTWTADGRYYIFQASQTMPNTTTVVTKLWAISAVKGGAASDGGNDSEPVELTNGPMSFGNATPGRESKNLWAIGVQPWAEVVKYNAARNEFVPVVPGLSATDLEFSADGKWIAYVSVPGGKLFRARADGSDKLQLTSGPDLTALPRWSPDGKTIAYVSMKAGESWKLYLVPAKGGTPQAVSAERGSQIDANWSADGKRLMFGDFNHDAAGLSIRILNFKRHETTMVPGSEGLFSPRWSPNGRYVAALSPDNKGLMLFDFQSKKWSKWLASAGSVNYPVWAADSQSLYFDDLVDGAESIRRAKVGRNEVEPVLEVGSLDRYMGALGIWSGRAADGSWMFIRDKSTQEVYQLSLELP